MSDNIQQAVYYYYEGDTLIITRDRDGGANNICIDSYREGQGGGSGLNLCMTISQPDWLELVRKIGELK